MSLNELDEAIERARRSASPFARQLFGSFPMDARGVQALLDRRREVTVAVVTSKGLPHAALVVAGCVDGRIIFSASAGSLLLRSLGDDSPAALTCSDEQGSGVMMRGRARRLGHYSDMGELRRELDKLLPRGFFLPDEWDGHLYQMFPVTVFGELVSQGEART